MSKKNVNDYIEEGIYGPKEVKPDEKRRFLGTYRERVLLALTKAQVMKKGTFPEVEETMQRHPDAVMIVNGKLGYKAVSAYTRLASKYNVEAQRVTSLDNQSDIGLVLTEDHAVHKEYVFIEENEREQKGSEKSKPWWKKFFGLFS
ncbi:YueI family protein [Salibacterium sp. K-3]